MIARAPTDALAARRTSAATTADAATPGGASAGGWKSANSSASTSLGAGARSTAAGKPVTSGGARKAPAPEASAASRCRTSVTKLISSGPATSSEATPVTVRAASPSSVSPRVAASWPSVKPGPCPIGLLLALRRRLLIVGADDLVREIRFRRPVDHAGVPAVEDQIVALLLAHLVDDALQLLAHLDDELLLLPLQLPLEVVGQAGGIAPLALDGVLLLAPGVGRHQRALLLQLLAELVELHAPGVHLLLHLRLFLLELLARRHAGGRADEHALDVEEADPRHRLPWRRRLLRARCDVADDGSAHHGARDDQSQGQNSLHHAPPRTECRRRTGSRRRPRPSVDRH